MKKLLLIALLLPLIHFVQAQEEIVKWTFPNNLVSDTLQNGTNTLNLTSKITIIGAGPITMTNGQTAGDYAATATGWANGMDAKYWLAKFKTTGYNNVKISYKQRAGGSNGGPRDFKIQYEISSIGIWKDIPNGEITLGNDWFTGVVTDLDLPAECQNQSDEILIRWIMTSNIDIIGGSVSANGISKIDNIIVTGMVITGLPEKEETRQFFTYPNPSTNVFTISVPDRTTSIEIYTNNGQIVYQGIPENKIVKIEKYLPAGIYFIRCSQDGKVELIKHIVR